MNALLGELTNFGLVHPLEAAACFVILRSLSVIYPPLPGFPIDIAGIRLFGGTTGFCLAESGIMLGATVAFGVGRIVRDTLPPSKARVLRELERRLRSSGWFSDEPDFWTGVCEWTELRLVTNPLFDPISYAAGLTQARLGRYVVGSLIGNVPSMLLFYALEAKAIELGPLGLAAVTVGFVVGILYVANHYMGA